MNHIARIDHIGGVPARSLTPMDAASEFARTHFDYPRIVGGRWSAIGESLAIRFELVDCRAEYRASWQDGPNGLADGVYVIDQMSDPYFEGVA